MSPSMASSLSSSASTSPSAVNGNGSSSSNGNGMETGVQNYIEHRVSKMDTLAGVAIKYGVEVFFFSVLACPVLVGTEVLILGILPTFCFNLLGCGICDV